MCPPAIGALLAPAAAAGTQAAIGASVLMGTAQSALTIVGQRQQVKAQARVQATATKQEQQRYLNEVSSMRMQQAEEQVAKAQRIQASTRKAREARATARVSSGQSMVAGYSVDALINDLTREEADYRFSETKNQEMVDVNRTLRLRDAGLSSQMNLLRINKPIEQPDYLGSLMSGAQTGLSTYGALKA